MGAIVMPAAADVSGVRTLLAVIADPAAAKAALDQIEAAQKKLADEGAALTVKMRVLTARDKVLADKEAAFKDREAALSRAVAAAEGRRKMLDAALISARDARTAAEKGFAERQAGLDAVAALQASDRRKLTAEVAVLAARVKAAGEFEARLDAHEKEIAAQGAAVDARHQRLNAALAAA